jgi:CheY-like chemotaxis protein
MTLLHTGTSSTLWKQGGISCVVVPNALEFEVELQNADGSAFLRKAAPTRDAARNEAEYLRLLLTAESMALPGHTLKPFAMLIEDDHDNRDAFAEALRSIGVRTLGLDRGRDAVRLAVELTPDLIMIDYRLPDISGAELCRRLRAHPETQQIPIIAVTAATDALREEGCVADAVLAKPCHLDTFLAAARLFLRHLRPAERVRA